MATKVRAKHEPLFHITRRQDVSMKSKWLNKVIAIGVAFIICALISSAMGGSFADFFVKGFDACFVNLRTGGISATKVLSLLENAAILLLLATAVVPAFKMKFWNIGAEGQVAISILVVCVLQYYLGDQTVYGHGIWDISSNPGLRVLFFIIIFACGIAAGAIWGLIPAIFKAKFKTNETLFTLMMNYVALILTSVVISTWDPDQGNIKPFGEECYLPKIGGQAVVINLIIIAVVVIAIFAFLKFSKRGYEINVVGGSTNTAKYIGLSVKKTIIRTMILSGAICGLCGVLLICGEHNNLTTTVVGGRGFTGVLIAWLSAFGPIEITLYSLLGAFMIKGGRAINYNIAFPDIMLSILFFVLIAFDFFVNYQVRSEKIETALKAKFPKLFKKDREAILEAPTNINDINDKTENDPKEVK